MTMLGSVLRGAAGGSERKSIAAGVKRSGDTLRAAQGDANEEADWMITYTDLVTLLLTLFVILISLATFEKPGDEEGKEHTILDGKAIYVDARDYIKLETPGFDDLTLEALEAQPEELTPEEIAALTALEDDQAPTPEPQIEETAPVPPPEPAPVPVETEAEETPPLSEEQIRRIAELTRWSEQVADRLQNFLEINALADSIDVKIINYNVVMEMRDRILFPSGSADLADAGEAVLARLRPALLSVDARIDVEGHTDDRPISTGRYPSNWELSAARAAAVVRSLIGAGVPRERLRAVGFADTKPRADNGTVQGRAANRRVSFVVVPEVNVETGRLAGRTVE